MLFANKIKELRLKNDLPQRKLAAILDIDTATYCKIEKGERKANKKQVEILAEHLKVEKRELISLWLADKITDIVGDEKVLVSEVFNIASENIKRHYNNG